ACPVLPGNRSRDAEGPVGGRRRLLASWLEPDRGAGNRLAAQAVDDAPTDASRREVDLSVVENRAQALLVDDEDIVHRAGLAAVIEDAVLILAVAARGRPDRDAVAKDRLILDGARGRGKRLSVERGDVVEEHSRVGAAESWNGLLDAGLEEFDLVGAPEDELDIGLRERRFEEAHVARPAVEARGDGISRERVGVPRVDEHGQVRRRSRERELLLDRDDVRTGDRDRSVMERGHDRTASVREAVVRGRRPDSVLEANRIDATRRGMEDVEDETGDDPLAIAGRGLERARLGGVAVVEDHAERRNAELVVDPRRDELRIGRRDVGSVDVERASEEDVGRKGDREAIAVQ